MSDDSDLMIAAAATAAVVTWMGSRRREHGKVSAARRRDWGALLRAIKTGCVRSWRETPGYLFVTGIRDALAARKKKR